MQACCFRGHRIRRQKKYASNLDDFLHTDAHRTLDELISRGCRSRCFALFVGSTFCSLVLCVPGCVLLQLGPEGVVIDELEGRAPQRVIADVELTCHEEFVLEDGEGRVVHKTEDSSLRKVRVFFPRVVLLLKFSPCVQLFLGLHVRIGFFGTWKGL